MSDEDWSNPETRSLGVFLAGEGIDEPDGDGNPLADDDFLLLVNSHTDPIAFTLPFENDDRHWQLLIDTSNDCAEERRLGGDQTTLTAASLKLLMRERRQ